VVLNRSVFIFACACGRLFQQEEKGSFQYPECSRLLVLEWRPEGGTENGAGMPSGSEESECAYAQSRYLFGLIEVVVFLFLFRDVHEVAALLTYNNGL
jgi:hypothetical protein